MGGCATKPKVLKSDGGEVTVPVPAPAPQPAKEVVVVEEGDKKKEGDVGGGGGGHEAGNVKEIVVEDDKAAAAAAAPVAAGDDQESKPRSLSNLFKSEEEKDSTPVEVAATSELVIEEIKATEKPKKEAEAKEPEFEKHETLAEQPTSPAFVDAPEMAITEKEPETKQAAKTEIKESSLEKKTEEAK